MRRTRRFLPIRGLDSFPFCFNITYATRFPIIDYLSLCVYVTILVGEAHFEHDAL
jgi:hypothetical protein